MIDQDLIDSTTQAERERLTDFISFTAKNSKNPEIAKYLTAATILEQQINDLQDSKRNITSKLQKANIGELNASAIRQLAIAESGSYDKKVIELQRDLDRYLKFAELYSQYTNDSETKEPRIQIKTNEKGEYIKIDVGAGTVENLIDAEGNIVKAEQSKAEEQNTEQQEEEKERFGGIKDIIRAGAFGRLLDKQDIKAHNIIGTDGELARDVTKADPREKFVGKNYNVSSEQLTTYLQELIQKQTNGTITTAELTNLNKILYLISIEADEEE